MGEERASDQKADDEHRDRALGRLLALAAELERHGLLAEGDADDGGAQVAEDEEEHRRHRDRRRRDRDRQRAAEREEARARQPLLLLFSEQVLQRPVAPHERGAVHAREVQRAARRRDRPAQRHALVVAPAALQQDLVRQRDEQRAQVEDLAVDLLHRALHALHVDAARLDEIRRLAQRLERDGRRDREQAEQQQVLEQEEVRRLLDAPRLRGFDRGVQPLEPTRRGGARHALPCAMQGSTQAEETESGAKR